LTVSTDEDSSSKTSFADGIARSSTGSVLTVGNKVTWDTDIVGNITELVGRTCNNRDTNSASHDKSIETLGASRNREGFTIQRNSGNDIIENMTIIDLSHNNTILSLNQIHCKTGRMSLSQESVAVVINDTIGVFGVEDGDTGTIIHNGKVNGGSGDLGSSRDVDDGLEIGKVEVSKAIVQSRGRLNTKVISVLAPSVVRTAGSPAITFSR